MSVEPGIDDGGCYHCHMYLLLSESQMALQGQCSHSTHSKLRPGGNRQKQEGLCMLRGFASISSSLHGGSWFHFPGCVSLFLSPLRMEELGLGWLPAWCSGLGRIP